MTLGPMDPHDIRTQFPAVLHRMEEALTTAESSIEILEIRDEAIRAEGLAALLSLRPLARRCSILVARAERALALLHPSMSKQEAMAHANRVRLGQAQPIAAGVDPRLLEKMRRAHRDLTDTQFEAVVRAEGDQPITRQQLINLGARNRREAGEHERARDPRSPTEGNGDAAGQDHHSPAQTTGPNVGLLDAVRARAAGIGLDPIVDGENLAFSFSQDHQTIGDVVAAVTRGEGPVALCLVPASAWDQALREAPPAFCLLQSGDPQPQGLFLVATAGSAGVDGDVVQAFAQAFLSLGAVYRRHVPPAPPPGQVALMPPQDGH